MCIFFLVGKDKKTSSELVELIFDKPQEDAVEFLLQDFVNLKKFDDYLKVLSFYHVERRKQDNCSQCIFVINLRYVYTEHVVQEKKVVKELRNYCIMRKENFIASRHFIHRLADLEK